jgi:hypothetical protein
MQLKVLCMASRLKVENVMSVFPGDFWCPGTQDFERFFRKRFFESRILFSTSPQFVPTQDLRGISRVSIVRLPSKFIRKRRKKVFLSENLKNFDPAISETRSEPATTDGIAFFVISEDIEIDLELCDHLAKTLESTTAEKYVTVDDRSAQQRLLIVVVFGDAIVQVPNSEEMKLNPIVFMRTALRRSSSTTIAVLGRTAQRSPARCDCPKLSSEPCEEQLSTQAEEFPWAVYSTRSIVRRSLKIGRAHV